MKIIIDISEERLDSIKHFGIKQNEISMISRALIKGTPFDSVIEDIKAEIQKVIDEDKQNCDFTDLDEALEIIDKHINGKENTNDKFE